MPGLASLARRLRCFIADRRGLAIVEFAAVLPVLTVMFFGCFETTLYILLQLKLDRTATSIADLISQQDPDTFTQAQLDDLFEAADDIMEPFDLATEGRIIVSSVRRPTSADPDIAWQRFDDSALSTTSQIGVAGGTATLPNGLTLSVGEDIIIAETFYSYEPTLVDWFFQPTTLYQIAFYRPRIDPLTTPPS